MLKHCNKKITRQVCGALRATAGVAAVGAVGQDEHHHRDGAAEGGGGGGGGPARSQTQSQGQEQRPRWDELQ